MPVSLRQRDWKRRLTEDTERLRQQAKAMKPGVARDNVLRRIRQNETASNPSEWSVSPGLKAGPEAASVGRPQCVSRPAPGRA